MFANENEEPIEGVVLDGPHRDIKSSSRLPQAFRIFRSKNAKTGRKQSIKNTYL